VQPPLFWKDKRYKNHPVENLTLPPVTQRRIPEPIPELLPEIHKETVREASTLPKPERAERGALPERSPDDAPPLNRKETNGNRPPAGSGSGSNPLDGFEVDL